MRKYFYNPPKLIKSIFRDTIWQTKNDKILLTFDDGPNPKTTEIILSSLQNSKVKSAFFCVGNNLKKYPELAKLIIDEGHIICNHTFNHKIITKLSYVEVKTEIEEFNQIYFDLFGDKPKYFRPPHGRFNFKLKNILNEYNLINVMWSLLTYDFKNDIKIVKFSIDNYLKKDSIILLHDNSKCLDIIRDSIEYILEVTSNKNLIIGDPQKCLK